MSTSPFLGIDRSATGKLWMMRTHGNGDRHVAEGHAGAGGSQGDIERQGLAICQRLQLPEVLGRLLASRGQTIETAEAFLNPRLRDLLPDPSTLRDMDKAVARIIAALEAEQQIAILDRKSVV